MIPMLKNKLDNNVKMLSKTAFTLIELLVVITIIMILLIGLSKIDLSKGQNQQKSLSFAQKIQTPIETTITNALVGKGVGSSLIVPNSWKIEISKSSTTNGGTGSVKIYYETGGTYQLTDYIKAEKNYEIQSIDCLDIDGNPTENINNLSIIIKGSNLDISSSCVGKQVRLISNYKKEFPHLINLNTVTGVMAKSELTNLGSITYGVPVLVDGLCSTNLGECTTGTISWLNNTSACGTSATWNCLGSNGGTNDSCSYSNPTCPPSPINGVCGATRGTCSAGSLSWTNNTSVCGTIATWNCSGSNGGTTNSCSYSNPACVRTNVPLTESLSGYTGWTYDIATVRANCRYNNGYGWWYAGQSAWSYAFLQYNNGSQCLK